MENNDLSDPDLSKVGGFLREQAEICHGLAQDVRDVFLKDVGRKQQELTLHLMLKLMAATSASASTMGRLKSTQIQHVLATARLRKLENADFAKTNSGSPA